MTTNKSSDKSSKQSVKSFKDVPKDLGLKPSEWQKQLDQKSYDNQQKAKGLPPRLIVSE